MAGPISVAGLAIGVVSLGFQVAGGITDYIDALNRRGQDISSVKQQNDSLRKTLQVVETSLSQLRRDHQDATSAVREWLDSCKKELEALESLVVNFTACDKGKKLLYPFNRPKLEQLETKLRNANAALQLALQTLGLSVSQLGTEKLATLEATSHNISTSLLVAQSEISAIITPLQGIHSTLSGFETRFDSFENLLKQLLVRQPASNGSPQEITPATVTGRLLAKPGALRDICDAGGIRARSASSGMVPLMNRDATHFSNTVSTYIERRSLCLCRPHRRLQRENAVWGSLTLSLEMAAKQHLPGCPATQIIIDTDRSRKISLTYGGLRHLLNSAVRLSFAISSGAGGWSLSPNFTYYPTVDSNTAPAFRVLDMLYRSGIGDLKEVIWREKLVPSAVSTILKLFRAKMASPQAVDANNRSLVYHLAKCIAVSSRRSKQRLPSKAEASPLLELLECLLVNKAPANDYDISGHTPLQVMVLSLPYEDVYEYVTDPIPAAAAELILRSNAEDNVAWLSTTGLPAGPSDPRALLPFLAWSTEIAEAYGCGPLSVAILSNNLEQVEHLVKNYPATLAERNLFGHTPLHLAADKPSCLRLLVKPAAARGLINQTDKPGVCGMTALESAVFLSGLHCQVPADHRHMCQQCRCDECAVVLLEANCAVRVPERLDHLFHLASKRCIMSYVRHMKDRRDRLKQLALDNLPITEIERLGLASERVLDSLAPRVIQLLQDRGICIPEALAVARLPVYRAFHRPSNAELFFQVGFHDTDLGCNAIAAIHNLPYLHWLAKHEAISCQLKSFTSARDIFTVHFIFYSIGRDLLLGRYLRTDYELPLPDDADGLVAWVHELNAKALPANTADPCRCKCAPGGCTPLTALLKGALNTFNYESVLELFYEDRVAKDTDSPEESIAGDIASLEDSVVQDSDRFIDLSIGLTGALSKLISPFVKYLMLFGGDLKVRHHNAALRYLTFTALGIRHSCCRPWRLCYDDEMSEDEVEVEMADELAVLEELLNEFEGELVTILEDPDRGITDVIGFWKQAWVSRMKEVLDHLKGSDLTDDERRGAEEIGVVWDGIGPEPSKVTGNPYIISTLDYWMYELEKIEAECGVR